MYFTTNLKVCSFLILISNRTEIKDNFSSSKIRVWKMSHKSKIQTVDLNMSYYHAYVFVVFIYTQKHSDCGFQQNVSVNIENFMHITITCLNSNSFTRH